MKRHADVPQEVLHQRRHGRATLTAQDNRGINSRIVNRQMAMVGHTIRKGTVPHLVKCVTIVASGTTSKNCVDHDLSMTLMIRVNVTMCILEYIIVT